MKVLVLDPDAASRDALRRSFSSAGAAVRGFASLEEGERAIPEFDPEIVVVASDSVGRAGEELIARLAALDPRPTIYALADRDDMDRAAESGADDFLWRPVTEARVRQLYGYAAGARRREAEVERMRLRLARAEAAERLPGRSPRWAAVLAALERAAASNASVLLTGESGTEKDAAAAALHALSPRGSRRFAYITEGESLDLATRERGTLFLSAVEATSMSFQEMLLAHLESGRPARFVVAVDEDPAEAVEAGRLLRPLFEALRENTVHLPPLRERGGDVALLARRFLEGLDPDLSLDPEALDALQTHDWPGNTHELKETLRRAARLSENQIGPTVLRSVLAKPLPRFRSRRRKPPVVQIAVGDSLADVERRLISKTLEFARGNKRKTAELLKLSLKTIYNKIKEYGLEH